MSRGPLDPPSAATGAPGRSSSDATHPSESVLGTAFAATTVRAAGRTGTTTEITVEVTGDLTEEGWIVERGEIIRILAEWDHRFLVAEGDPLVEAFRASGDEDSSSSRTRPPRRS